MGDFDRELPHGQDLGLIGVGHAPRLPLVIADLDSPELAVECHPEALERHVRVQRIAHRRAVRVFHDGAHRVEDVDVLPVHAAVTMVAIHVLARGVQLHPRFSERFQQWPGRWPEIPVDAHMLISLIAPRPVFVTGGTGDQWADPKGEFLAQVAAGPVYRLLGARDLGTTSYPTRTHRSSAAISGSSCTPAHTAPPGEWATFVEFLSRYFTSTAGAAR